MSKNQKLMKYLFIRIFQNKDWIQIVIIIVNSFHLNSKSKKNWCKKYNDVSYKFLTINK